MQIPKSLKPTCIIIAMLVLNAFISINADAQKQTEDSSFYEINPVYVPPLIRPEVNYSLDKLKFKNIGGELPTFDGEQFQINLNTKELKSKDDAKRMMGQFLESLEIPLKLDEQLRMNISTTTAKADKNYIEEQIKAGNEAAKRELEEKFKDVSQASDDMIDEFADDIRSQAYNTITIYTFDEYFENIPVDNTSIILSVRNQNDIASFKGNFFNTVKPTNKKNLSADEAIIRAVDQLKEKYKDVNISGDAKGAILVLLPYEEGFKYVWKAQISADGPYMTWIDAETAKILQLFPEFFYSNAKGLVFNPSPTEGTIEMSFEVDPPSGGKYTLNKSGVLTLTNYGTDGTSGIVTINDDGSGTANFNVAPINGTVVERTSQTGYNGLFQQVNIYAHLYNERMIYMALGSQNFGQVDVTFNKPGGNSFCCPPKYHIGNATVGSSTSCDAVFNAGCDATVIAHEFGHRLNSLQFGVGSGSMTSAINEGLADFWACTNFNTDIFGGWWGHNCTAPTQGGWVPRQSEPLDVFPEHSSLPAASIEGHSSGQIMSWAMWSTRQGMNDATGLGTLSINLNTIKAMTTAGSTLLDGSEKSVHDSYQNLLKQLVPLYKSSRLIHKLLSGYARAGIFLSPKDAIIDINDSYLDRASASGPVFTIWTGADYTFNSNNTVNTTTQPFNTQYLIEIANNEAFTSNLVSSGWLTGVTSAAGGTATWLLPSTDWNTLKAADAIYYRVTTKDASGANLRYSWQPGNNFLAVNVPVGKAAINNTGEKDCSCSAAGGSASSAMSLIPLIPIGLLIVIRRKSRKNRLTEGNEK